MVDAIGSHAATGMMNVASSPSSKSTERAGEVAPLMSEPGNTDIGLVIAKVEIDRAFTARKAARQDRQSAMRSLVSAQAKQVSAMRHEADSNYAAAMHDAWGKALGGAFNALGGGLALAVTDPSKSAAINQVGGGLGSVASAITGWDGAGEKLEADHAGATAKAAEMEATAFKDTLENADDELKEAREHADKALEFLRELSSAQSKTQSAAIRA